MKNQNNFSWKIFALYQSISDDLVFWSIFNVLILSQLKGFDAVSISLVFTVSYWVAIVTQFPSYIISRKIGAGYSVILAAVLFLMSALLITFSNTLFLVALGQGLYQIAASFQKMSLQIIKSAASHHHSDYHKIMSVANTIYSIISLAAALSMTFLVRITAYLPMYICIGFCLMSLILAVIVSRYDTVKKEQVINRLPGKRMNFFDRTSVMCLFMSMLGMVVFSLVENNYRIILDHNISKLINGSGAVLLYSIIMIATRLAKLSGNGIAFLFGRLHVDRERSFYILVLLSVFVTVIGLLSIRGRGWTVFLLLGSALLIKSAIFDSYKVYLSYYMLDRLKSDKMTQMIFADSFIVNLFTALFSSLVTVIIAFFNMDAVVILIFILGVLLLAVYLVFRRFLIRRMHSNYYNTWDEKDYTGVDSLIVAATVLLYQYNIFRSKVYTPRYVADQISSVEDIDKLSRHIKYDTVCRYTEEKLYELYRQGIPCAIRARVTPEDDCKWLAVIYLDDDGGIVWNERSFNIFINQFDKISEICSFKIV